MNDNKIYLDTIEAEHLEKIRKWRNENTKKGILRTPFKLTHDMQLDFFKNVINNRSANSRYFGIFLKAPNNIRTLVGYCGIDKIEWENGIAEIGILIGDHHISKGYGSKAIELLLNEAFYNMRLQNIYGECYKCNPNIQFWYKMIDKYKAYKTILINKKYYKGLIFDSIYFNFNYKDFGGGGNNEYINIG